MEPNQNVSDDTQSVSREFVARNDSKKNNGMLIGMIILAILAVGGVGFGVWAMMDGNAKVEKKDAQITELNKQVSELNDKLAESSVISDDIGTDDGTSAGDDELNGDIALDLLQEASVGKQLGYGVGYANVHAKCVDGDKVSYWVTYANSHRVNTDVPEFGDIMFEKDENGEWKFELPGFTSTYTDEYVANCTVIHGGK